MKKIKSINPSTYQILGEVNVSSQDEIKEKVEFARKAQKGWGMLELGERIEILRRAIEELEMHKEELAFLESREMGMPISEATDGFDGAIDYAKWYFDNAEKYLSPETTLENDKEIHQVFYEPVGVVGVIVPWNFPLDNFIWGAIQSLIAGNAVVFKHSEECPLCGKFIEDIFSKYLPEGVLNMIYGDGETGKILIHENIDMVSFTGSTKTGKSIFEEAGKKFIKSVMELGGSAPGIIFEDANIEEAINSACSNRLYNAGQCCDGLKRLVVHENIFDEVVKKVADVFSTKKVGNAEESETQVGPLVAKRQLDLLVNQVEDAIEKGVAVVTGGNSMEDKLGGAFFQPTVLIGVTNDMRIWNEEVFGPVLPIVKFKTEQEAIDLSNQTSYGLGAYVFTNDAEKAQRVSRQIETGMVSVNGVNYVMPFNPFGGCKNSGHGREHGKYGYHEVTRIKLVAKNK